MAKPTKQVSIWSLMHFKLYKKSTLFKTHVDNTGVRKFDVHIIPIL